MSAKKFALQARKRRITPFLGVLDELFRGSVVVWGVLGELFRGTAVERGRWESFVPGEPVGRLSRESFVPGGLLAGACWGSFVPGLALGAVQSSPCSASWWCERYKVLPAGGRGGGGGTKFSLLGQNRLKWAILGVLGEFCTGWAAGVGVLGEFCTGWAAGVGVLGEFCTGWAAGGGVRGAISHAIPLSVFQNLNSDR